MAVEGAPSYAELQHRLARAEHELAEAREREVGVLEWQTATSEILRVIASSPTDLAGVLDSIIQSAARLTGANYAAVLQAEGNVLRISATLAPETSPVGFAQPFDRGSVNGRVLLDGVTIHEFSPAAEHLAMYPNSHMIDVGFRVQLVTPLLREGVPIGTLLVARRAWVPFTDRQVQLLETFADQAVIAIENTRLFTELQACNHDLGEALEQQTATAEILGIISRSPTELQSVMDAVVERAARLCEASGAAISLLDGDVLKSTARYGSFSRAYEASPDYRGMARPVSRDWPTGRAVVDRQTIHIPDLEAANEAEFPLTGRFVQQHGHRSAIFTPLLREDAAIGTLAVCRQQVGPFTERQIEVLKIFADQAVIAIENARLFAELEDRNRDLGEALERQTATAEILRVIASSPTDLPAVLDAVVRSAAELCEAAGASVLLVEDDVLRVAATYGTLREAYVASAELRGLARPINREWVSGRAVVDREVLHIHDLVAAARDEFPGSRAFAERHGHRSTLYVPLLREDEAIGVLALARPEVRPFTDQQIDLVRTFADQAVIAIANTRLFRELAGRVEELKALGEVGQAVSASLNLQEVLGTVLTHADRLSGTDGGALYEYDEAAGEFRLRATRQLDAEVVESLRAAPVRLGEGAVGRAALAREPVQIPDITAEGAYRGRLLEAMVAAGQRAVLAVPLLREGRILGGLVVVRKTPGAFPPSTVDLARTFASQSALAIQNARLYREIEDKGRQLEEVSRHKSEFLANMSHELRTPLNAIIGFSEVLLERLFGELNDKQAEYLGDILTSGQHLLSLINDILDLSKVEAGRMELELSEFSLREALENGLTMLRERAGRHGITLGLDIEDGLDLIQADERKVKQVVFNLLSNAVKFTPDRGRVAVSARIIDDQVQVAVRDTGVGIAPVDLPHVFDEFRQVGHGETRHEGSGLGLALARSFVELHGGRIWAESAPGVGSTFTFTLPRSVVINKG